MRRLLLLPLFAISACHTGSSAGAPVTADDLSEGVRRLPTGVQLDPAGRSVPVGQFPLAVLPAGGDRVVLQLNGYAEQGIQVVDTRTGAVTQKLTQEAAFLGLTFDHAGSHLYSSGGNQDVVYRYEWSNGAARLQDSLVLAWKDPKRDGKRYPAGLALSSDDRLLYVAENLVDTLAVIDLASGKVIQRLAAGRYPYAVLSAPDGSVYASDWGGSQVTRWRLVDGKLQPAEPIAVGRHPSALLLNRAGSQLFVASASTDKVSIVDTRTGRVTAELSDSVPGGTGEGSTPNALALSADEGRLYVAEADNNAVAVFDLTAGNRLLGRIPVGWYPAALLLRGDTLIVANGKGLGTAPNKADGPGPGRRTRGGYTLSQLTGTLSIVPLTGLDLGQTSTRVARANGWDRANARTAYPPFEHVIYVLKENRTYDQVLGDLRQADGDTSLLFFPRSVSPNHHALAERFGIFDRFFVNAEVSADGHNWSMAAYATDYVEKTVQQNYSGRGRSYDFQGTNRGVRPAPDEDAAEPARGYLWDLARRKGITFHNFGEFTNEVRQAAEKDYAGLKPFLEDHTEPNYPGFDLQIPDQHRADLWLRSLEGWERSGQMPALQILYLPNDHTAGARAGELTPRAYMADNDLALGRVVEALSKSRFWRSTIMFVLEDDAQNGPDHVDSHRSPLLVISPWNHPGVWHRFTNTTDIFATIEEILSLDHLSQFDAFGRPLRGIFTGAPDLKPYQALKPQNSMTERNPAGAPGARESSTLDFSREDRADDDLFNRALWLAIKGSKLAYPGATVMTPAGARKREGGV